MFFCSSDLAFYDGLSEAILSAGIAKPKPNVFQPQIEYLLVLATTVEIVLLGVTFSGKFYVHFLLMSYYLRKT